MKNKISRFHISSLWPSKLYTNATRLRLFGPCLLGSSLLVLFLSLNGCGRYGDPLAPLYFTPTSVKYLEATVDEEANTIVFNWESPDEDRRGKELTKLTSFEILRADTASLYDFLQQPYRNSEKIGTVISEDVALLEEKRREAREQKKSTRNIKIPKELTQHTFTDRSFALSSGLNLAPNDSSLSNNSNSEIDNGIDGNTTTVSDTTLNNTISNTNASYVYAIVPIGERGEPGRFESFIKVDVIGGRVSPVVRNIPFQNIDKSSLFLLKNQILSESIPELKRESVVSDDSIDKPSEATGVDVNAKENSAIESAVDKKE